MNRPVVPIDFHALLERARVVQQAFQLHAHRRGIATAAGVFGFQNNHRVFAVHDHIAGTNFLSDFHKVRGAMAKSEAARGGGGEFQNSQSLEF